MIIDIDWIGITQFESMITIKWGKFNKYNNNTNSMINIYKYNTIQFFKYYTTIKFYFFLKVCHP